MNLDPLRGSGLRLGVDPMGGAGVRYWGAIAERYRLPLTIVSDEVDPTFRFMTVDRDGKIRMDCSSPWAMQRLIHLADRFDVAWGCDPDHDRHGIVARQQRPDESERLSRRGHLLSVRPPARLVGRGRGRQDGGEQQHDRPGGGAAGPPAGGGAGRLQVVRRRPHGWLARIRRRGERRRHLPAPRRRGVDHRQGRNHPRAAGRRDDGGARQGPRRGVSRPDPRPGRSGLRADRRAGHAGAEGGSGAALSRPGAGLDAGRAKRSRACSPPRPATARRSADSRWSPRTAGSRPGPPAPKTSTSSTPRASGIRTHLRRIQEEAQAIIATALGSAPASP